MPIMCFEKKGKKGVGVNTNPQTPSFPNY